MPGMAAGGNASTYYTDCNASMGNAATGLQIAANGANAITSKGWNLDTAFVDTFLLRPETANVQIGINGGGLGGNANASLRKGGNADLHIVGAVLDQFTQYGIFLTALTEYAAVQISDSYAAPTVSGTACYAVTASNASSAYGGAVSMTGNQCIAWTVPGVRGFYIANASGVSLKNNIVSGSTLPITFDTVTNFSERDDTINNPNESASQAAVYLNASSNGSVAPIVKAGSTNFPQGVNLNSTGNSKISIDPTGISASSITGGATNKVVINGTAVTAQGASGTHWVTGVMN
jgi:hypothetical protein